MNHKPICWPKAGSVICNAIRSLSFFFCSFCMQVRLDAFPASFHAWLTALQEQNPYVAWLYACAHILCDSITNKSNFYRVGFISCGDFTKLPRKKSPRSRSHIFVKCMRTNPHMMKRNFDPVTRNFDPVTRHAFSSTTISPRKRLIYNLFPDRQAILVKLLVQGRMGNKPKTLEQSGAP